MHLMVWLVPNKNINMADKIIIDMGDSVKRARLLNMLGALRGRWRIELMPYRPRRSDRQNRYYWPCFVQPFAQFLRDQGESYTDSDAHEMLKYRFLHKSMEANGEHLGYTPSTAGLDTSEFNAYLDACAAWLNEFFGIQIPDSSDYREA